MLIIDGGFFFSFSVFFPNTGNGLQPQIGSVAQGSGFASTAFQQPVAQHAGPGPGPGRGNGRGLLPLPAATPNPAGGGSSNLSNDRDPRRGCRR